MMFVCSLGNANSGLSLGNMTTFTVDDYLIVDTCIYPLSSFKPFYVQFVQF